MLSKKDAESALEGANGMKVRAGMAETLVKDKQKRKKLIREERKLKEREKARKERQAKGEDDEGEDTEDDEKEDAEQEQEQEQEKSDLFGERMIAVDWALSKDKWEEAKAKMQDEAGEEADSDAEESSSEVSSDDDDDSHIGVHQEGSDSEGSDGSDEDSDDMDVDEDGDQKPIKPQLPDVDVGTTLFVRNVPFEATEDELRTTYAFNF